MPGEDARDILIAQLQALIAQLEGRVAELEAALAERDADLAEADDFQDSTEAELEELRERNRELVAELAAQRTQTSSLQSHEVAKLILRDKAGNILRDRTIRLKKKIGVSTAVTVATAGLGGIAAPFICWAFERGFREKQVVGPLLLDLGIYKKKGWFTAAEVEAITLLLKQFQVVWGSELGRMKKKKTHNKYLQHADFLKELDKLLGFAPATAATPARRAVAAA